MSTGNSSTFNLQASARQTMLDEGFEPDFPPEAESQLDGIQPHAFAAGPSGKIRDLRGLLWSSIDNDTSRDLDQIEVAEALPNGSTRVMVGIADVDEYVPKASPIDQHAAFETTTVYTGVRNFSMLPERLSTDLSSLSENEDRLALIVDMTIGAAGTIESSDNYRAWVRNKAQLTYNGVGPWLEGKADAPPKVAASADLQAQLKLQDSAAKALRAERFRLGALNFDRIEAQPIVTDGHVQSIEAARKNRATALIEDFMIAANEVIARRLRQVSSIRRIVKTPERWPRIVELAARYGEQLPAAPDSGALNAFLQKRKAADPVHYADISLAVVKLMGPGEYVLERPGDPEAGHFGLAAQDYTHSTAPNRRFADLVTQRILKAGFAGMPAPYTDDELGAIARNCTLKEDSARKVERVMTKRIAAVALRDRIGEVFHAVVTGANAKGTFVRVLGPPVEGRVMRGDQGLDVGDQLDVKLLSADPQRGFIDFAAVRS